MQSIVLLIVNTRPFNISVPMGWAFLGLLIEAQPNGYIIQRDEHNRLNRCAFRDREPA